MAEEHAPDSNKAMIKQVLENNAVCLGLLLNERFVNIPAQISVPLLENLVSEMKRATSKKMPFEFTHFILICKLYKINENVKAKGKKNKANEPNVIWSNPEEEIVAEAASASFEFSVEKDSDSGLSGSWTEGDDEMMPFRRVLLLDAHKLPVVIESIKNQLKWEEFCNFLLFGIFLFLWLYCVI